MSFLKRLSDIFTGTGKPDDSSYWITVKCDRCGEIIQARIDLRNDLSINYGEAAEATTYFCRKVLMGSQHCYQQIEVELTFDAKKRPIQKEIRAGKFVEEGES